MTYSVGTYGAVSGSVFPNNLTTTRGDVLPDSCALNTGAAAACATAGGGYGGMQNAMAQGAVFLAQQPDGSTRLCKFDDRSTPGYPILLPVGP